MKELERINAFRKIFGQKPLSLENDKREILAHIEASLSPENLSRDGEASLSERQKRLKDLKDLYDLVQRA